jgi:hypothetical protein
LLSVTLGCGEISPAAGEAPGPAGTFASGRHELISRLAHTAGIAAPEELPRYRLFTDLIEKGARTGATTPVEGPDASGVIHRLRMLPCSARDGEAEARWLLQRAWSVEPAPVWSTGLAALVAERVYGRPAEAWRRALSSTDLLPSLGELLEAPDGVLQYPTLFAPAAWALVAWTLERHGAAGLQAVVKATRGAGGRLEALAAALRMDPRELQEEYRRVLAAPARGAPSTQAASPGAERAGRELGVPPDGFQRGICFAHTVSLQRGYASPRSEQSLDQLRKLGVNWISVTPFGYLRLHSPEITASSSFGPDAETDESLAEVISQARSRGMGVLLKPHLWSTDFVGQVAMRSGPEWSAFFREYGRFLAHHAILASACGASALSIGNELIEATRGRDDEWRTLIRAARSLFAGPLTYGAHWGEEVERVGFWDALDWVGVSLYAPLESAPQASRRQWAEEARRQAQRLAGIARRFGKPLVLVEAGFPSHARAALAPWEDPESGPADPAAQADAFAALIEGFASRPEVRGIYWWKWFTDDRPSRGDRSHRFAGKPAEEVVRRFYAGR